jgi:hypothetical protein
MGMTRTLTILVAAMALLLGACGDDDAEVSTPGAGGNDAPAVEAICLEHDPALDEYLGLTLDEATALAEGEGFSVRVVGEDAEEPEDCYAVTLDLRGDRVNLELAAGLVIAAAVY